MRRILANPTPALEFLPSMQALEHTEKFVRKIHIEPHLFLTPPVGFYIFYLKGATPPEIPLMDIY